MNQQTIAQRARRVLLEAVFQQAADVPQDQRRALLDRLCVGDDPLRLDVEELLRQLDSGTLSMLQVRSPSIEGILSAVPDEKTGEVIGPYTLVNIIGEGGFGAVWRAEQEKPVRRSVALKILKPGMDTKSVLARFDAERQALAVMDHPNIAKVFDAGSTPRGRPFFVMEFVKGEPLNLFCDARSLSLPERLELFVQVCRAIQHAHQKGVIHRDLKPSNILVSDVDKGVPKVIDFGIAKALNEPLASESVHTTAGQIVGTPEYMSPEQAAGRTNDVDTRTDVYSLGVILYELITGSLPFDSGSLRSRGFAAMQKMIQEVDPPRPSDRLSKMAPDAGADAARMRQLDLASLRRRVRGDLEWITLRAMEKDPPRRYASAADLALDIERHLRDEPVSAGPPGKAYKLRKFARRNRAVVFAALAVSLAVCAGLVAASVGFVRASEQRDRAVAAERIAVQQKVEAGIARDRASAEADKARAVAQFLQEMLASVKPSQAQGREVTVKSVLDASAPRISDKFKDKPELLAELQHTIGSTYRALEKFTEAETHLSAALETRKSILEPGSVPLRQSRLEWAHYLVDRGRFTDALPIMQQLVDEWRAPNESPEDLARGLSGLSRAQQALNRFDEAEKTLKECLDIRRRVLPAPSVEVAGTLDALGRYYDTRGHKEEAIAHFNESLEIRKALGDQQGPEVASTYNNIGSVLHDLGRYPEAEKMYKEALERSERITGREHTGYLLPLNNLAILYQDTKRYSEAEEAFSESLRLRRKVLGNDHPTVANAISNLGGFYILRQRYEDSLKMFEEAFELQKRVLGLRNQQTISTMGNIATAYERMQRYEEAIQVQLERNAIASPLLGPQHRLVLIGRQNLGQCLRHLGEYHEAEAVLREVFSDRAVSLPPDHPDLVISKRHLMWVLCKTGKIDEAFALYEEICAHSENRLKYGSREWRQDIFDFATLFKSIGREEEAARWQSYFDSMTPSPKKN